MHAPLPPSPLASPTMDAMLLVSWQQYPSIARVATPYLRLAGVRIEPKNHSKHDTRAGTGLLHAPRALRWCTSPMARRFPSPFPEQASRASRCGPLTESDSPLSISRPKPSNSGSAMQKPERFIRWTGARLNPMFGQEMQWMPDQKSFWSSWCLQAWAHRLPRPLCPMVRAFRRRDGQERRKQHL